MLDIPTVAEIDAAHDAGDLGQLYIWCQQLREEAVSVAAEYALRTTESGAESWMRRYIDARDGTKPFVRVLSDARRGK